MQFNYMNLDPFLVKEMMDAVARINTHRKKSKQAIFEIGRALAEIRPKLAKHGEFGRWVKAEFDWSQSSAENFMNVFSAFGDRFPTVANLRARTLYRLSTRQVPAELRDEIIELVAAGKITDAQVIERITASKGGKRAAKAKPVIPTPEPVASEPEADDEPEVEPDEEPIAPEPDEKPAEPSNVFPMPFQRPDDLDKRAAEAAGYLMDNMMPGRLRGFIKLMAAADNNWSAVADALEAMRDIAKAASVH